ncbi:MAG: hypothetical protein K2K55_06130 [Duncaniella sp.]|nr:hypothetical protein [Duncaniella sp.]
MAKFAGGNSHAEMRALTGVADQVTHYYPWGSVYGDLGSGASLQPFKYGDKELDLSNGIARYDYSARAYFPSIPRFDRIDRYADNYPHTSPYTFCANNPVNVTDPTGERIICYIDGKEWELLEGEYGYGFYNSAGELFRQDTNDFIDYLTEDLNNILSGKEGNYLVNSLIRDNKTVYIKEVDPDYIYNSYNVDKKTIKYNPTCGQKVPTMDVRGCISDSPRPPFIGLGHELAHAFDDLQNKFDYQVWCVDTDGEYLLRAEISAIKRENQIRREHGLPKRVAYKCSVILSRLSEYDLW